jgi:hypothetical protein
MLATLMSCRNALPADPLRAARLDKNMFTNAFLEYLTKGAEEPLPGVSQGLNGGVARAGSMPRAWNTPSATAPQAPNAAAKPPLITPQQLTPPSFGQMYRNRFLGGLFAGKQAGLWDTPTLEGVSIRLATESSWPARWPVSSAASVMIQGRASPRLL